MPFQLFKSILTEKSGDAKENYYKMYFFIFFTTICSINFTSGGKKEASWYFVFWMCD